MPRKRNGKGIIPDTFREGSFREDAEGYVLMVTETLRFLRAYHGPLDWLLALAEKARRSPSFVPSDRDIVRINELVAKIRKNGREEDHGLALPTALD